MNNLLYSIKKLTDTLENNNDNNRTSFIEFNKRYSDTFIYIIDELQQTKKAIFFVGFDDDYQKLFGKLYTTDEILLYHQYLSSNWHYIKRPTLTKRFYFNHINNEIYYLIPNPKRQWKRGISTDNYTIFNINYKNETIFDIIKNITHKRNILYTCLNQQPHPFISNKIIKDYFINTNNNTLFIDNNFFILKYPYKNNHFYLFFHNFIIAEFNTSEKLSVINPLFNFELSLLPKTWLWTT